MSASCEEDSARSSSSRARQGDTLGRTIMTRHDSDVNEAFNQANTPIEPRCTANTPTSFEPGCVYWLMPMKAEGTSVSRAHWINNPEKGFRTALDIPAYGHPVIYLELEGADEKLHRVVMVSTFGDLSYEDWKISQSTNTIHYNSLPIRDWNPSLFKAKYPPVLYTGSGDTPKSTLFMVHGRLEKQSYARIDRILEVHSDALEVYRHRLAALGPPKPALISFRSLMNSVGLNDKHRDLYFEKRTVSRTKGADYSQPSLSSPPEEVNITEILDLDDLTNFQQQTVNSIGSSIGVNYVSTSSPNPCPFAGNLQWAGLIFPQESDLVYHTVVAVDYMYFTKPCSPTEETPKGKPLYSAVVAGTTYPSKTEFKKTEPQASV